MKYCGVAGGAPSISAPNGNFEVVTMFDTGKAAYSPPNVTKMGEVATRLIY